MPKSKRQTFSAAFKSKVALAAIQGEKTIPEIASQFQVHPTQVSNWKKQVVERISEIFAEKNKETTHSAKDLQKLHAKIGELTLENDFLAKALNH